MKRKTRGSLAVAAVVAVGTLLAAPVADAKTSKPAARCPQRAGTPCQEIGPRPGSGVVRPRILPAPAGELNGQQVWRYGRYLMQ